MNFRSDLPFLVIYAGHFQAFDHGEKVIEPMEGGWNLRPGDIIRWELAQFSGTAKVVELAGDYCVIEKQT